MNLTFGLRWVLIVAGTEIPAQQWYGVDHPMNVYTAHRCYHVRATSALQDSTGTFWAPSPITHASDFGWTPLSGTGSSEGCKSIHVVDTVIWHSQQICVGPSGTCFAMKMTTPSALLAIKGHERKCRTKHLPFDSAVTQWCTGSPCRSTSSRCGGNFIVNDQLSNKYTSDDEPSLPNVIVPIPELDLVWICRPPESLRLRSSPIFRLTT